MAQYICVKKRNHVKKDKKRLKDKKIKQVRVIYNYRNRYCLLSNSIF